MALQDVKSLPAPPSRDEQQQLSAPWSPWRAVAARLLWAHYLVERGDQDMLDSWTHFST